MDSQPDFSRAATQRKDDPLDAALRSAVHDLRSPVQTLFSSIDALDNSRLEPHEVEAFQRIVRSTQALDAQIRDLATLVHLQSGALAPAPVSFEVGALLEEVEETAPPSKHEPLLVVQRPDVPIFVFADAGLIRQMLARIVCVLSKVPREGPVRLSVDLPSPQPWALTFRAQSASGCSLSDEVAERLLLVRLIAASLGGKFERDHQTGSGGCFVLTVPVRMEDPDAVPPRRV